MRCLFIGAYFIIGMFTLCVGQSIRAQSDTIVTDGVNKDKYRIVTNKFFDNWFLGVSAGTQILFGDHDKQMQLSHRFTPAYNAYIGKWFTPGISVRVGYTGNELQGLTHNDSNISYGSLLTHSTGVIYQDVKRSSDLGFLEVQRFKYNHIHADVLINIFNLLEGYNQFRFYNLAPYVGVGWAWVNEAPQTREPSINLGFYNSFRLSSSFSLNVDVRGSMMKDDFDGELGGRSEESIVAGTIGLSYNLKKRHWDKEKIQKIQTYDETELNILSEKINLLVNDNEALKRQLAEASNSSITDLKIEKNIIVAPILITFPLNKSIVSNEARVNLGFLAKAIHDSKSTIIYTITGYADKVTGSRSFNEKLSKERAEAIYNVLVREFNVSPSRLTIDYNGGVDNMYYDDPRLSRAVIVLAQ